MAWVIKPSGNDVDVELYTIHFLVWVNIAQLGNARRGEGCNKGTP